MSTKRRPSRTPQPAPAEGVGDDAASRVVHELNNLIDGCLRNVSLAITQLRHDNDEPVASEEGVAIDRLETASLAMREMAALVRQWARISDQPRPAGALTSAAAVDPIATIVPRAVRLLNPVAARGGITMDTDVAPEAALLSAGPIFPVLINAIRNSVEALTASRGRARMVDAGGQIHIRVRIDEADVVLEIIDDGPGIAPGMLDDSGEFRFGWTTKPQGHGVGLSLCRDMVAGFGGTLTLGNRRPDPGAVLTCRIPQHVLRTKTETPDHPMI